MSLILELQPDTELLLREKAASQGIPLDAYVTELIKRDVFVDDQSALSKTPQERAAAWLAWANSHQPLPVIADDSRESIYAGCGE